MLLCGDAVWTAAYRLPNVLAGLHGEVTAERRFHLDRASARPSACNAYISRRPPVNWHRFGSAASPSGMQITNRQLDPDLVPNIARAFRALLVKHEGYEGPTILISALAKEVEGHPDDVRAVVDYLKEQGIASKLLTGPDDAFGLYRDRAYAWIADLGV